MGNPGPGAWLNRRSPQQARFVVGELSGRRWVVVGKAPGTAASLALALTRGSGFSTGPRGGGGMEAATCSSKA